MAWKVLVFLPFVQIVAGKFEKLVPLLKYENTKIQISIVYTKNNYGRIKLREAGEKAY